MHCRSFSAQPSWRVRKLQSRSIWRNRWRISFKMGVRSWRRRFRAAATDILPRRVHSRFSTKSELTTPACMEKLWMRRGTRLSPMLTRTCRFLAEENLFPRRCIISCVLTGRTGCMPDICRAILRRTAVFLCPSSTQSRFSTRLV